MSGTTRQRAVHEIRLKPNKDGTPNIVKPKELFDCPDEDLKWLQAQGACVDSDEPEPEKKAENSSDTKMAAMAISKTTVMAQGSQFCCDGAGDAAGMDQAASGTS